MRREFGTFQMVMRSILTGNVRTTAPAETSASRLTPSKADFPDCPTLPPFQRRLANVRFFNRAWRSSSLFQPSPSYRSCGSRFFSWSASRPKPAPPQALVGSGRGASLSDALTAQQTLTAWPRVPRPHGRTATRTGFDDRVVRRAPPLHCSTWCRRSTSCGARQQACGPPRRSHVCGPWHGIAGHRSCAAAMIFLDRS